MANKMALELPRLQYVNISQLETFDQDRLESFCNQSVKEATDYGILHTSGKLLSRGCIAGAIFIEGVTVTINHSLVGAVAGVAIGGAGYTLHKWFNPYFEDNASVAQANTEWAAEILDQRSI